MCWEIISFYLSVGLSMVTHNDQYLCYLQVPEIKIQCWQRQQAQEDVERAARCAVPSAEIPLKGWTGVCRSGSEQRWAVPSVPLHCCSCPTTTSDSTHVRTQVICGERLMVLTWTWVHFPT